MNLNFQWVDWQLFGPAGDFYVPAWRLKLRTTSAETNRWKHLTCSTLEDFVGTDDRLKELKVKSFWNCWRSRIFRMPAGRLAGAKRKHSNLHLTLVYCTAAQRWTLIKHKIGWQSAPISRPHSGPCACSNAGINNNGGERSHFFLTSSINLNGISTEGVKVSIKSEPRVQSGSLLKRPRCNLLSGTAANTLVGGKKKASVFKQDAWRAMIGWERKTENTELSGSSLEVLLLL